MIWKTLIFAFLLAGAFADEYKIPEESKSQLKSYLVKACKDAGAEDKVDEATNATHAFVECVKELVNFDQIKTEIELAKPNGALDEVFKKYCAKTPQLKTCIHTLLEGVSPCVESSARSHISTAKNSTDQLIDFVCYKDGDRIALFIAEHGPECIQSKSNAMRECLKKLKSSVPTVEAAKELSLETQCAKFDEMSTCIVTALENCDTPTPGNMAESLLKYIRKGSPCPKKE